MSDKYNTMNYKNMLTLKRKRKKQKKERKG